MLTFLAGVIVGSVSLALVVTVLIGGSMKKVEETPVKAQTAA